MLAQPHLQNAAGGFPFDNIFTFHLMSVMSESPPIFLNLFHVLARRRLDATVCGAEKFKFKFKIVLHACGRPVWGRRNLEKNGKDFLPSAHCSSLGLAGSKHNEIFRQVCPQFRLDDRV